MGVGSGLYMYDRCRRKTFTFAISSSDELLCYLLMLVTHVARRSDATPRTHPDSVRQPGEVKSTQAGRYSAKLRRLSFRAERRQEFRRISLHSWLRLSRCMRHSASGMCVTNSSSISSPPPDLWMWGPWGPCPYFLFFYFPLFCSAILWVKIAIQNVGL